MKLDEAVKLWKKQCKHLDDLNEAGGGTDVDHFQDSVADHDNLSHVLVEMLLAEVERLRDSVVRLNQELDTKRDEVRRLQRRERDMTTALNGAIHVWLGPRELQSFWEDVEALKGAVETLKGGEGE